ncbi:MAG: hypothetical protein IH942_01295 [Acidobacteria bacterium]|nr:hypothetical protein [Acidobacteriota bacterium]
MKKLAVLVLACGVALAVMVVWKRQSAGPRRTMGEKMQERMEAMPEDFPPRVMFDNVATTKENALRILELLEKGGSAAGQEALDLEAKSGTAS